VATIGQIGDHAPHGGPIVLPVVDQRPAYMRAIAAGTILTAVCINLLKARSNSGRRDLKETS
jgi:fructose PTS system EIIBC or EIIC component